MKDDLLNLLPEWRFVKIEYGVKGPRYKDWQHTPYTLEQIPQNGNIGVLTGPHSNGILAIDFDGPFAWKFWDENIKLDIPQTVTWSSGRESRCQMAFKVPTEMWEFIPTIKIADPNFVDNGEVDEFGKDKKADMLEFRWSGVQSVLPPSMHPDTKKPYQWILSPQDISVADMPIDLLDWIINYQPAQPKQQVHNVAPIVLSEDKLTELANVMDEFKKHYPTLGYEEWFKTAYSCMTHVGIQAGTVVMSSYYPAKKQGEYDRLARYYSGNRNPPGIGSLIEKIRYKDPTYRTKAPTQQQLIKQVFGFKPKLNITF